MDAQQRRNAIAKIYARAWSDPGYLDSLKSDPGSAFKEAGLHAPDHLTIHVHEESASDAHFVIPQRPAHVTDEQLSGSDLHTDVCSVPELHPDVCSMT